MDFHKLTTRFRQFGGMRLVLQYAKLGALAAIVKGIVSCVVKRHSYQFIYPEVLKRIEPMLIAKYGSRVLCKQSEQARAQEFKQSNGTRVLKHKHPKVIWWCWLQGLEKAPNIVKACHRSLQKNLKDYEIKIIDSENWKQYVQLPDYIVERWNKKQIPPALFSDLLRLQLLIKHGGTWIDSTVLCTGFNGSRVQEFKKYLDADLFLFQYTPEGTTKDISISNWFISAHSNNVVLMAVRDMLFAYWKDYNCTLDYYIFHLFFSMVAKEYPEEIAAMPYGYSMRSLTLLHHWGETFNQKKWDKLTSKVAFHKLAFRISDNVKNDKSNFYHFILNTNLTDDPNNSSHNHT